MWGLRAHKCTVAIVVLTEAEIPSIDHIPGSQRPASYVVVEMVLTQLTLYGLGIISV